jgi:hypothetical protein
VPKGLHKPAHRTIIVQICSLKSASRNTIHSTMGLWDRRFQSRIRTRTSDVSIATPEDPHNLYVRNLQREQVRTAIQKLPIEFRIVLVP